MTNRVFLLKRQAAFENSGPSGRIHYPSRRGLATIPCNAVVAAVFRKSNFDISRPAGELKSWIFAIDLQHMPLKNIAVQLKCGKV